mmetsp:Transcript_19351/g.73120  ORF Transcript_19351/g.73120 Transcript_19351/m.73120 type:complete len:252 (+) Transcript_19351:4520-5275(+)
MLSSEPFLGVASSTDSLLICPLTDTHAWRRERMRAVFHAAAWAVAQWTSPTMESSLTSRSSFRSEALSNWRFRLMLSHLMLKLDSALTASVLENTGPVSTGAQKWTATLLTSIENDVSRSSSRVRSTRSRCNAEQVSATLLKAMQLPFRLQGSILTSGDSIRSFTVASEAGEPPFSTNVDMKYLLDSFAWRLAVDPGRAPIARERLHSTEGTTRRGLAEAAIHSRRPSAVWHLRGKQDASDCEALPSSTQA